MRQVPGSRGGAAAICGVAEARVHRARRWRRAGSNERVNLLLLFRARLVALSRRKESRH